LRSPLRPEPALLRRRLSLVVAALAALALGAACGDANRDPLALGFAGPGRLAVLWELPGPAGEPERALVIYDREGARRIAADSPQSVRFLSRASMLVALEAPAARPEDWGRSRLALLDVESAALRPFGEVRRWFDPEPAPDGRLLAVAVQVSEQGDSELEIWGLDAEPERLAVRPEPLDEPHFSPDGFDLVAARSVQGAGDDDGEGGPSFAGIEVPMPRLFRLRRDLIGPARMLADGVSADASAPGGTLPLWWDARGIYARQAGALVRCAPRGEGCQPVWAPPAERFLADARPFGERGAILALADSSNSRERSPTELRVLELESGDDEVLHAPRPGRLILDLDWTE
jgi:hypothetical protein